MLIRVNGFFLKIFIFLEKVEEGKDIEKLVPVNRKQRNDLKNKFERSDSLFSEKKEWEDISEDFFVKKNDISKKKLDYDSEGK